MSSLHASFEVVPLDDLVLLFSANRVTGRLEVGGEQPCDLWLVDGCFSMALRPDEAPATGADAEQVEDRIVEALFPLLLVPDADYDFHAGETDPTDSPVRLAFAEALDRAHRRLDDWKAIAASIPSLEAVARLRPSAPAGVLQVTVDAADWPVLALADGHRTVADLVEASGRNAYDVCIALHRLLTAGLIDLD